MVEADSSPQLAAVFQRIAELEKEVLQRLQERHALRRWRNPHPEVVRVWGRVKADLSEIRRLLERCPPSPPVAAHLLDLLAVRPDVLRRRNLDAAREFSYSVRAVVPLCADAAYQRALFESKQTRRWLEDAFGKDQVRVLDEITRRRWSDKKDANRMIDQLLVDHLVVARLAHDSDRRKQHARLALGSRLLWLVLLILLPLVLATGAIFVLAIEASASNVLIAGIAGALGSVLSGVFKLRELRRLRDLRTFGAGLAVQPVIGAAAGLFMFLLVRVGVLHLPPADENPSIESFGLYGFLGGFSEPFLLGVVQRLSAERESTRTTS